MANHLYFNYCIPIRDSSYKLHLMKSSFKFRIASSYILSTMAERYFLRIVLFAGYATFFMCFLTVEVVAQEAPVYDASVPKPTLSNISYGKHERHILDFWKAEANSPTPLVFVVHGGGWKGGEKERLHRFANVQQLLDAGISVVAINYRLMRHIDVEEIIPPVKAPMYDAGRALQFVRSKADEWNIDKERIGAAGGSAGACTSLWLAYHDDLAIPESKDPIARESTRLWSAAVMGPQTTLDPQQMKEWIPNSKYGGHAFGKKNFDQFLAERESIMPWIAEYSPYALTSTDDPPVYLSYNAPPALGQNQKDPTHSANFGVKLQERCNQVGIGCELKYPNAPYVKHASPTDYLITSLKGADRSLITRELQKKPNVLFIAIDDLRPELGCYGKSYIQSPNIDKLAESAAVFTNHFVQVPTCGASRFSMLTGMLPKNTGHLGNNAIAKYVANQPSTDGPETFIHHLKNQGYYTVGIGKISHSADGLLYGYTDKVSDKRELPKSWDELVYNSGKWKTGWNAFFGYANGENRQSMNRQVKPYEMGDVDDAGYPDGLTSELALEKLNELAKRNEPFFLGVGFFKPHLPFNAPKKYWDMYNEDDLPIAPFAGIPQNSSSNSLHGSGELNGYQLGEEKGSLEGLVSDAYARKLRHAYFASISYIDAQVGKLTNELEKLGLADNTIIVIWGDHGWHLGDHMTWGKHTIFERSLNSTFLIKAPGKIKSGSVNKVVSSIDIYPTLMELCEVKMPHQTNGKSLVPLLSDPSQSWEDASFGYFKNGISLRTERYRLTKYFRNQEPAIELYDHEIDPNETKNIAAENPAIVKQLLPIWEKGNTGLYD